MGELSEPNETGPTGFREFSRRRIFLLMAVTLVIGAVIAAITGPRLAWLGVLIGGALSFVNFVMLDRSTKAMFARVAADPESASAVWASFGYILRYLLLGLSLWLVSLTGIVPMAAVIGGVASFAVAIVLDGMIGIFNGIHKRDH